LYARCALLTHNRVGANASACYQLLRLAPYIVPPHPPNYRGGGGGGGGSGGAFVVGVNVVLFASCACVRACARVCGRHSESSEELVKEIEEFKSFITDANKRRLLALAGHSPYTDISQLVTKSGASKRAAWTADVNSAFQALLKDIKRVLTENCIIPITEVDFYEEYDFFEELGQGSFATVFRCKNKTTGEEYAVKKIEKKKLTVEDDWALRNEVSIMSQLRHPNIVQLEVAYESTNCYFLVMELVTGGELFERLLDKRSYSEREARNLVRILLEALAFCHRKNVVHRDLKPENILLSNIYDDAAIKIADFGFAQKITPGGLNTDCGSPWRVITLFAVVFCFCSAVFFLSIQHHARRTGVQC
jgi:hypothetical protein